jgi:hypothetical protein
MNGGITEYERILKEYRDTEDNQIRKYAMFTLGATKDMKLKLQTLDWTVKSGEVKMQDTFYPIYGSFYIKAYNANTKELSITQDINETSCVITRNKISIPTYESIINY